MFRILLICWAIHTNQQSTFFRKYQNYDKVQHYKQQSNSTIYLILDDQQVVKIVDKGPTSQSRISDPNTQLVTYRSSLYQLANQSINDLFSQSKIPFNIKIDQIYSMDQSIYGLNNHSLINLSDYNKRYTRIPNTRIFTSSDPNHCLLLDDRSSQLQLVNQTQCQLLTQIKHSNFLLISNHTLVVMNPLDNKLIITRNTNTNTHQQQIVLNILAHDSNYFIKKLADQTVGIYNDNLACVVQITDSKSYCILNTFRNYQFINILDFEDHISLAIQSPEQIMFPSFNKCVLRSSLGQQFYCQLCSSILCRRKCEYYKYSQCNENFQSQKQIIYIKLGLFLTIIFLFYFVARGCRLKDIFVKMMKYILQTGRQMLVCIFRFLKAVFNRMRYLFFYLFGSLIAKYSRYKQIQQMKRSRVQNLDLVETQCPICLGKLDTKNEIVVRFDCQRHFVHQDCKLDFQQKFNYQCPFRDQMISYFIIW